MHGMRRHIGPNYISHKNHNCNNTHNVCLLVKHYLEGVTNSSTWEHDQQTVSYINNDNRTSCVI